MSSEAFAELGLPGGGEPWRILDTTFKSYPSQIHTQGPIGLALELGQKVHPVDIESIVIQAYQGATSDPTTEPEKWDPKTRETADHSIPFLVATALQDGAVTPASFTPAKFTAEGIQSPAVRTLIDKMVIQENEDFTRKYPAEYNCRIEITDRTGKSFVAETSHPKGHRLNPMTDSEVEAKFRSLASVELTDRQCQRALQAAWDFDALSDLNDLYDTLVV